jgi:hypothetical protein
MSVFHENMLIGSSGQGAPAAAGISRSIRLNAPDSAYLSRTPASAGNRKTWTLALWVKRSNLSDGALFHSPGTTSGTAHTWCNFSGDTLQFYDYTGSVFNFLRQTAQVFRDPSAWYHLVFVVDTDNGTAANRARIYVNGSEVTTWTSTSTAAAGFSTAWNNNALHQISSQSQYFNGYLADIYFIDGQALTPSSFTETDATTGQLIPKAYTGSYGTNGFHLEFSDNSGTTSTTLGKDSAGSNNWTPNNFSVSSGAGNDSLVDVPTNGDQTDTGVGGEVRGNYCTLNPLNTYSSITLSNGNLDYSHGSSGGLTVGTIGVSTGKWYWEHVASTSYTLIGLYQSGSLSMGFVGASGVSLGFTSGGFVATSGGPTYVNSVSYGTSDVIGFALNMDAGTLTIYKNGSATSLVFSGLTGTWFPAEGANSTSSGVFNFGARSFAYTAPSGFKALNTANLPAPGVTKPNTVMDVVLYTGTGSALTPTSTLGFNPDLVWIKSRSAATDHALYDSVRGVEKRLESNNTDAEVTSDGGVTAFNSAGFSVGTLAQVNTSSATYAAWTWDAGSSTDTNNTAGTITPTGVRANATAGVSVVTYTGNGTQNATVAHGLGVKPALHIIKNRSSASNWVVLTQSIDGSLDYAYLNSTAAFGNAAQNAPTSTVFSVWNDTDSNANGSNYVAYCFAPVVGYSAMGSFSGGSGIFTYTGFRPKWLLIKQSSAVSSWIIYDTSRDTYNVMGNSLYPNLSDAEISSPPRIDFVSNGFVTRASSGSEPSWTGTVIYYAVAKSPFNYARAR